MPIATITFQKLIQDSQDYGSNDDHMVSRVFFNLDIDGNLYPDLYADVKQIVGSAIESSPIEVSNPGGYKGPFDHDAFSNAVERYYRSLVGATGSGIRISGATNVRMRNNTFFATGVAKFEVKSSGGPW